MNKIVFLFVLLFAAGIVNAQAPKTELTKIGPNGTKEFSYPYFVYVPSVVRGAAGNQTILVLPNNTGKLDDDLKVHEDYIVRRANQYIDAANKLGVIVLIPVFPRPKTDWKIYTHALDRDSLITDKEEYKRFDLQLLAMIDDTRKTLEREKIKTDKRVLLMGFSASGMFALRFAFLHPERVKAAAVGSPGGWPIAPVSKYEGNKLRYPIGVDDLKLVSGRGLQSGSLRKISFFVYMGDQDDNDSVPFEDGYEPPDKNLIFELFGKTPVERWEISKKLFLEKNLQAEFKLYPNVKHSITDAMIADVMAFLRAHK